MPWEESVQHISRSSHSRQEWDNYNYIPGIQKQCVAVAVRQLQWRGALSAVTQFSAVRKDRHDLSRP